MIHNSNGALKLAGKLSNAAAAVCYANAHNLSSRVQDLEETRREYDDYIVDWTKELQDEED